MATLKEQLASAPDITRKTVTLLDGALTAVIRRFTVKQRDEILAEYKNIPDGDLIQNSALNSKVVSMGLVDSGLTEQEISELPAIVVQQLAEAIMYFNGWTKEGRAALIDQFRTPTGSAIQVSAGEGTA